MRLTALKASLEIINATATCPRPGIGSREAQESRCLTRVCLNSNVVRMRQDGFLVGTPQCRKALSIGQCVSTGTAAAVDGLKTSGFVTVVPFTCTSWGQQAAAFCDTVATGSKVSLEIFSLPPMLKNSLRLKHISVKRSDIRTFALIVYTHLYYAHNSRRNVMLRHPPGAHTKEKVRI